MLAIRGQVGDTGLRGRVRAALARPSSLRLEGLAPFGAPGFVLVAQPDNAVLVLPRERRVVTEATGSELLEALAGVALGAADFRAVLTGCVVPDPRPLAARVYGDDWIAVELEGDATLYLRMTDGTPSIVAGRRGSLIVEYLDHTQGLPRRVRVQSRQPGGSDTDFIATLSQVNINVELHADVFIVQGHDEYIPMTFEELRGTTGPLEEQRSSPAGGP